jgi:hypothetical protein
MLVVEEVVCRIIVLAVVLEGLAVEVMEEWGLMVMMVLLILAAALVAAELFMMRQGFRVREVLE